jgi:hypothetical protein
MVIAPNPDGDLIRICAEHIENHAAFNTRAGEVPMEEDPRWDAYWRTLVAMCDSEPKTLAGIIAKARAAQVEAIDPQGDEVPDDEVPLIWSIVKDLIRLGEEQSPDAELIAACDQYLSIQRALAAAYDALGADMDNDDPAWALLDPASELEEKIVALHAQTAEGHFARARCVAFFHLSTHRDCQDDPEDDREDRWRAANLRDVVRLEQEATR